MLPQKIALIRRLQAFILIVAESFYATAHTVLSPEKVDAVAQQDVCTVALVHSCAWVFGRRVKKLDRGPYFWALSLSTVETRNRLEQYVAVCYKLCPQYCGGGFVLKRDTPLLTLLVCI